MRGERRRGRAWMASEAEVALAKTWEDVSLACLGALVW